MTTDRLVGGVFVLIASFAFWHAYTLVVPFAADPVGPRVFPMIVSAILGVSGVGIMLRPAEIRLEFGRWMRVLAVLAACVVYPFLLVPAGFILATSVLIFVCALAFEARPLPAAASAIITSLVFFFVLDTLLDLPLPVGPLGF